MKLVKRNLRIVWLVLILSGNLSGLMAQREVKVPSNVPLNEFIHSDTVATGARVDTNTIYVLERGKLYEVDSYIRLNSH